MSVVRPESLLPWRVVAELDGEPTGPAERHLRGAVLVADITGYTRITQRLCDQGDEGLGQLSDLLDREFSRYLDVVAAQGGEVLSFAGDALIACFLASSTGVEAAAARAEACAAALAALSGTTPAAAPGEQVTLHVGVAAGSLWIARVGGWYGRWELLVGGPAVRAAFAAASSSSTSRASVPEDTSLARGADAPRALDDRWWWGLVPPRLIDEARAGRRMPSELRQVSALFVRVTGLDEDGADALALHQELVFAVHETLRTISTASGRFLIDDRGLVFVLVMGDPGNAHADDVERALSFAKALEARAAALRLKVRMGFAAGRTFCGVIGNRVRHQYVAIGPAMNLAARLMDATGGGLIAAVPLPVHRLSRFRLIPEGTLRLKGIGDPVGVARVEADETTAAPGALYGREPEQRRLDEVIDGALRGKGGLAVVIGEAGIGKSTLVAWFRRRASERGLRCVLGEGDPTEAASTYFAFRPILRALLGAAPHDSVDVLRTRLVAWLATAGRSEAVAPLFNSLLPLQLPETATTLQLRGQTRAEVLVDLLVELVRGASAEPLAILIEDAHWIDSASALLIEQITARLDRPLVLLTARPEAEEGALGLLRARVAIDRFELAPLALEAIAELAAATCGGPVEPSVVGLLREQTAGNPLFAQEYVRELRDSGRLAFQATAWRLSAPDGNLATAPTTLQGLIASRIDGLSPEAQAALRVAAVIGPQVDRALLEEVMARTEGSNLAAGLASLARRQLLLADGGGEHIRFAHALIQAVAYDSLLFETRVQLHRAVAEAIERRTSREPGQHVLLVYHWSRARDRNLTVAHAESAAEEAIQLGAYREARAFASLCVQAANEDPALATPERRARWQLTLADAAAGLGDLDRRRMHATNALELAGRRIPRTAAGALLGGAALLAARGLRRLARRPPAPAANAGGADLLTRAYRQMAVVAYFENEPFQILCYAAKALVNAERVGPSADLCGAFAELGAWFGFAGFEPLARPFFSQAFDMARALDDRPAQAHVNMVHSLYSVGRAEWERVRASLDRCQALCLEIGDRVQWANAQIIRFWLHHYRGERQEAAAAAKALDECARESGNLQQRSWGLHALGICRIEDGAIPEALDLLTRSVSLVEAKRDRTATLSTLGGLALAHALGGDAARALEIARGAMDELSAIRRPMGHAMLEGLGGIAEVMVRRLIASPGEPSAVAEARTAVALLRRQAVVFPIAAPRFRYWQARLREIEGRSPARARRRGLEAARMLGMGAEARRLAEPPALRRLEAPRG